MKTTQILFGLLCMVMSFPVLAQQKQYASVDQFIEKTGGLPSLNVAQITDSITRPFTEKGSKMRAIFTWVAQNIALDPKAIRSNDQKKTNPEDVILSRATTPLGFSLLIQEMSSLANIRCLSVDGYVKNSVEDINNPAEEINHSWNVVQLGQSPETWYYIDAAKASGSIDSKTKIFQKQFTGAYFFADRFLFNLDHYPDNPSWQLGNGPKTMKEFYALPLISNNAFRIGLQQIEPITGFIKTKATQSVKFKFSYKGDPAIQQITLNMGDDKKPWKPEPILFSDAGGIINFSYQFKKADSYPVRIVADGKVLLTYSIESEE